MNKAELKAGGTIRVKHNKTIKAGEEILFAYHYNYWRRWGAPKRGRPTSATSTPAQLLTETDSHSQIQHSDNPPHTHHTSALTAVHHESHLENTVTTITEENGVRVVEPAAKVLKHTSVRGRRKKARDNTPTRARKRQATQYTWTATSRDEFNNQQRYSQDTMSAQQRQNTQRFERGEGGGVT